MQRLGIALIFAAIQNTRRFARNAVYEWQIMQRLSIALIFIGMLSGIPLCAHNAYLILNKGYSYNEPHFFARETRFKDTFYGHNLLIQTKVQKNDHRNNINNR